MEFHSQATLLVVQTAQLLFLGWFLTLFPGEGAGRSPGCPRGREVFVHCINKEIVWLERLHRRVAELRLQFQRQLSTWRSHNTSSLTWRFDFQFLAQISQKPVGNGGGVDVCAGGGAQGAARRHFPGVRYSPVQHSGTPSTEIILFLPSDNFCASILQPGLLSASLPIGAGCITVFIFPAPL